MGPVLTANATCEISLNQEGTRSRDADWYLARKAEQDNQEASVPTKLSTAPQSGNRVGKVEK